MLKSLILLVLGGGLLLLAVLRLRRYRLKERYALIFLLLGLPFFALAAWPNAVGRIADVLDMDYRTVTLLCVAGVLALLVFELLTIVSVQDQKITALAQLVAEQPECVGRGDVDLHIGLGVQHEPFDGMRITTLAAAFRDLLGG